MKIWTITAVLASLTLLTACGSAPTLPAKFVEWQVRNGQPIAVIEKRPGMEIAYIADASLQSPNAPPRQGDEIRVERISTANTPSSDAKTIELKQFPFVIKMPGQKSYLFSCSTCAPCISGDDCVPPVPPNRAVIWEGIWSPAIERFAGP